MRQIQPTSVHRVANAIALEDNNSLPRFAIKLNILYLVLRKFLQNLFHTFHIFPI
jgi:hypothetical protein